MSCEKKLLFARKFSDSDFKYLFEGLTDYYDIVIPDDYNNNTLAKHIQTSDICLGGNLSKDLLVNGHNLQLYQSVSTGVNSLDLELMEKENICICNTHSSAKYVAEFAISLMFTMVKKIHIHDEMFRKGELFSPATSNEPSYFYSGSMLDKKIGFLGFGSIGQHIAKYLTCVSHEIYATVNNSDKNRDKYSGIVNYVNLEALLSISDVIFITVPLTIETKCMINKSNIDLLKNTFVINVSRAEVIDESSLIDSLANNHINGYASDVWRSLDIESNPFVDMKNTVLSPHRAGYYGGISTHLFDVVDNLINFSKNDTLMNIVSYTEGY